MDRLWIERKVATKTCIHCIHLAWSSLVLTEILAIQIIHTPRIQLTSTQPDLVKEDSDSLHHCLICQLSGLNLSILKSRR
jgi:hypothetical protein